MNYPVFYRPEMVARTSSYSRSASKPAAFVECVLERKAPVDILSFDPVTRQDFYLAHDKDHVDSILDLSKPNGFDNKDMAVSKSLPYTTGSMLAAARHVLKHRGTACSPTSGFHHAGYDFSGGFCTFNGLMVTALKLKQEGVKRVGILDCDFHYGDGTQDIIDKLGLDWITHRTSGAVFQEPTDYHTVARWLRDSLDAMSDCDLILYQAGQDMHMDDPLGGVLPTYEMVCRDRIVNRFAIDHNMPVAWNLAGGYMQRYQQTIDGHIATLRTFGHYE